jgi:aminopeptidase-like protein
MNLIASLACLDRCHNGPEMAHAYEMLVNHYPNARILNFPILKTVNHWRLPPRWTCYMAELRSEDGELIATNKKNKLEVFSFSPSVDKWLTYDELQPHLLSDPKRPDACLFHFRNQYRHWAPSWGFSIPHNRRDRMRKDVKYHAVIRSSFSSEDLIQSDYLHKGWGQDEFLILGHFDHPSQVNDGLSGCIAAYEVIRRLSGRKTKNSYRAFSSVEIVGSVAYLERQVHESSNFKEALFLGFVGIDSPLVYQQSFYKKSKMDRIAKFLLQFDPKTQTNIYDHRELIGNDENIFDSIGYEISTGTLMRWPFPQYHTDADNLVITSEKAIEEVISFVMNIIEVLEYDCYPKANFDGVPSLANPDIDLYMSIQNISGLYTDSTMLPEDLTNTLSDVESLYLYKNPDVLNRLMQNMLRMANGQHSLFDIAEKSKVPFGLVRKYALRFEQKGLLTLTNPND